MGKIIQPFGRIVARVLIEVDERGQSKVAAVNLMNPGAPVPMEQIQFASVLSQMLTGVIQNMAGSQVKKGDTANGTQNNNSEGAIIEP